MKKQCLKLVLTGFLSIGILFAGTTTASAQDAPRGDSVHLNLQSALEMALSESPTIKIADRSIEVKKYAKKEQVAALWPSLTAAGTFNRTLKKQVMAMEFNGETMEIAVGTDNSWSGGLNLGLPIIAPALWKTIQLSEKDVELAVESARASRIGLITQVKTAYYALLLAKDSYGVLLQNYNNVEANTKNITDKYNQGLASEFDMLRAEVELKNQRPALTQAWSAIHLAELQLKIVIGVDVDEPLIFDGNLASFEAEVNGDVVARNASFTLDNNTSLRQLDIQRGQLDKALSVIRASFLPTLSLGLNYTYTALNDNFNFGSYNWNPYSVAAFQLSVPIFSGMSKRHKMSQAKLNIQTMEDTRLNTERALKAQVAACMDNINTAIENLASNKENMAMAEKAYSISKKQYEVGMSTWLDLSASELALTSSRLAYHQSIYNYLTGVANLENVLGTNQEKQN